MGKKCKSCGDETEESSVCKTCEEKDEMCKKCEKKLSECTCGSECDCD